MPIHTRRPSPPVTAATYVPFALALDCPGRGGMGGSSRRGRSERVRDCSARRHHGRGGSASRSSSGSAPPGSSQPGAAEHVAEKCHNDQAAREDGGGDNWGW